MEVQNGTSLQQYKSSKMAEKERIKSSKKARLTPPGLSPPGIPVMKPGSEQGLQFAPRSHNGQLRHNKAARPLVYGHRRHGNAFLVND